MPSHNLSGCRRILAVSALAGALIVGCGGEETDISGAIADSNKNLAQNGASIDCPKKVDGGDGTKVKCTIKGKETGKTAPLELKVQNGALVPVDQQAYEAAVHQVTGQ